MEDSLTQLAKIRARKSKKSLEELKAEHVANTADLYAPIRLDDDYLEEKQKFKQKYKPFYDRLKDKG